MLYAPGREAPPSTNGRDLPGSVNLLRYVAKVYLAVFKRFRIVGADQIPATGPVIFVANHTAAYDPVCLQVACHRRLIRFMQAREYYEKRPVFYMLRWLQVIPVNRTGNDTASIRTAMRVLQANGCVGIFPEGKISTDGEIHEARKGVALLAVMANATVVPAYMHGARPFRGMLWDFLRFNRVTLYLGNTIRFDDLAAQRRNPEVLETALQRIMGGIVALRDQRSVDSPRK